MAEAIDKPAGWMPRFSLERFSVLDKTRERLFYLKREEQLDLYLAGLRKAGVSET